MVIVCCIKFVLYGGIRMRCSNCNQVLPDVAVFCENCGVRLSDLRNDSSDYDEPEGMSGGKKTLLFIIITLMMVIVLLVSAILGITLYLKSENKKEQKMSVDSACEFIINDED